MTPEIQEIPIDSVVFRKDLYPRIEPSVATVQQYAENLDVLPPIEINQRNELIDGWNRWTAHKKKGRAVIGVIVTQTASDMEVLELAIERNATHGLQLSLKDKEEMATRIYGMFAFKSQPEREAKKSYLQQLLSVDDSTIRRWTSRTDKDVKAKLRQKAFDLWLSCHTQQEIAAAIGYSDRAVRKFLSESFRTNAQEPVCPETVDPGGDAGDESNSLGCLTLTNEEIAIAAHDVAFKAPIYNVWKWKEKTAGPEHFGNSEPGIVDNLLYLYTKPFDVVVDPFAGGGSTINVCKNRLRRYWVADRKPVVEHQHDIREHDLTTGLPRLPWQDVRLVYLDPPYWKQAEGEYSNDLTDLANMPLDEFSKALATIINGFAKKLSPGAVIALLMQPTQWKAPEHQYTDHVVDMARAVKLRIDMRVQCPYESQQANAQQVEWAKASRKVVVLSRELVIWRVE